MKNVLVIDSSVVVKWFVSDENQASPAMSLLSIFQKGGFQFVVPDLLFYEVGNVFLKKWKGEVDKIQNGFASLWRLPWFLIPLRKTMMRRTLAIASQYNITFYDALFVATAEQVRGMLITADEKLLEKIKQLSFAKSLSIFV